MTEYPGVLGVADQSVRMCNCIGPQPGHRYCPCVESAKNKEERQLATPYLKRIADLEAEVARLKEGFRD